MSKYDELLGWLSANNQSGDSHLLHPKTFRVLELGDSESKDHFERSLTSSKKKPTMTRTQFLWQHNEYSDSSKGSSVSFIESQGTPKGTPIPNTNFLAQSSTLNNDVVTLPRTHQNSTIVTSFLDNSTNSVEEHNNTNFDQHQLIKEILHHGSSYITSNTSRIKPMNNTCSTSFLRNSDRDMIRIKPTGVQKKISTTSFLSSNYGIGVQTVLNKMRNVVEAVLAPIIRINGKFYQNGCKYKNGEYYAQCGERLGPSPLNNPYGTDKLKLSERCDEILRNEALNIPYRDGEGASPDDIEACKQMKKMMDKVQDRNDVGKDIEYDKETRDRFDNIYPVYPGIEYHPPRLTVDFMTPNINPKGGTDVEDASKWFCESPAKWGPMAKVKDGYRKLKEKGDYTRYHPTIAFREPVHGLLNVPL